MKKLTCYVLLLSFIVICCTACAKKELNELLQTEHVPGSEVAVVHTATPVPTASLQKEDIAPTDIPEISPMPELLSEAPAFMDMYMAMAAGTRINTEGVPEEEIRHCFCDLKLPDQTRQSFSGQTGLDWQNVRELGGIRVLYYRSDGRLYVCDVISQNTECENIMRSFYLMYQDGQQSDDLSESLPEELELRGYSAEMVFAGNAPYLYIHK